MSIMLRVHCLLNNDFQNNFFFNQQKKNIILSQNTFYLKHFIKPKSIVHELGFNQPFYKSSCFLENPCMFVNSPRILLAKSYKLTKEKIFLN